LPPATRMSTELVLFVRSAHRCVTGSCTFASGSSCI